MSLLRVLGKLSLPNCNTSLFIVGTWTFQQRATKKTIRGGILTDYLFFLGRDYELQQNPQTPIFDDPMVHIASFQCKEVNTASLETLTRNCTLKQHLPFIYRPKYSWNTLTEIWNEDSLRMWRIKAVMKKVYSWQGNAEENKLNDLSFKSEMLLFYLCLPLAWSLGLFICGNRKAQSDISTTAAAVTYSSGKIKSR